jgi:hypothetical protein
MSKSLYASTVHGCQEGLQDHSLSGDVSKRFHLVYPQSPSDLNCAAEDSSQSNEPPPESTVSLSQYNCHHRGGAYSCSHMGREYDMSNTRLWECFTGGRLLDPQLSNIWRNIPLSGDTEFTVVRSQGIAVGR